MMVREIPELGLSLKWFGSERGGEVVSHEGGYVLNSN
jgi:hypothetical protein